MAWPLLLPLLTLAATAVQQGPPAPPREVERHRMVGGFERVRIEGPFDVEMTTGAPNVTLVGPPLALDGVAVRVEANTLVIDTGTTGWQRRTREIGGPVKIRVAAMGVRTLLAKGGARIHASGLTGTRLDLALDGAGSLDVDGIRGDQLVATHTGTGPMRLAGVAGRARILGYGTAAVDASGLRADEAVLVWQSTGDLTIDVRYAAQVANNGQGLVTVIGKPECRVGGTGRAVCAGVARQTR